MAAIRFYTDEQVAKAVVRGLRARGVDVLTAPEAGMLAAQDIQYLQLAAERHRAIYTQDDDFLKLAAAGVEHAGIVYAPQTFGISEQIRGLLLIHDVLDSADMVNHIEYL